MAILVYSNTTSCLRRLGMMASILAGLTITGCGGVDNSTETPDTFAPVENIKVEPNRFEKQKDKKQNGEQNGEQNANQNGK